MPFGVSAKIAIGLTTIAAIGMVAMLLIYRGLDAVERTVHKLAKEEGPFNAAAYEMEVNVNGIGLAVLKYLATQNPRYSQWVAEDHTDFVRYHATYMGLARTADERQLGDRVSVLYAQYKTLGDDLLRTRDRQEELFSRISLNVERIREILERHLKPVVDRDAAQRGTVVARVIAAANMEADIAESGFRIANYRRAPSPEAKALILRDLREFRETVVAFRMLNLDAEERRHAAALQQVFEQTADAIGEVVAIEDSNVRVLERFVGLRVAMDELFDNQIQPLAVSGLDAPRLEAERAAQAVRQTLRYLIPAFVLSAALVGYAFVRSIMVPLKRLQTGTAAVSSGDLGYRIPPMDGDEFGRLAQRFNDMTEQLEATTVSKSLLIDSEAKLRQSLTELRREIGQRERAQAERATLETALRKSETLSAMGALTAGVAHEVRNPLFGMSATLDAMEARFEAGAEPRRYVEVLRGEVDRMTRLMGDLLDFGKPAAMHPVLDSPREAILQALRTCAARAETAGVTLVPPPDAALPSVRGDRGRLAQVFQNLLDNAIHYAPRGGQVEIGARTLIEEGRTWIEFDIADRGAGFRPEDLPKVFEPFFTRRHGGTGMGLSIVLRIVEAHGGSIRAANRAGGGALLSLRLPAAGHADAGAEDDGT